MSALETVRVTVPEAAAAAYVAAFERCCRSVAWFSAAKGSVEIEGVREPGDAEAPLALALALAAAASGSAAVPIRTPIPDSGWPARVRRAFPPFRIGRRFAVRGRHVTTPRPAGRITLVLDVAMAFGSGEHGSTQGCLLALERLAPLRPRRILDLGTGSGILGLAAARFWHRPVLAVDIDPHALAAARRNARVNALGPLLQVRRSDGLRSAAVRHKAPYDLVVANIFARPLCAMAQSLGRRLAPSARAVLAGFHAAQAPMVLAAYLRARLVLERRITVDGWTTLTLRAPPAAAEAGLSRLPALCNAWRGRVGLTCRAGAGQCAGFPATNEGRDR